MLTPPSQSGGACWFDNYDGEEAIVIEEFSNALDVNFIKQLLDKKQKKPVLLPVKGKL